MEEHLISKKELLQQYGISYGALYRWKRKGLIPEEWFIKKSTVTGQETFFDRKTICERIDLIIAQKEDLALDDLASKLAPSQTTEKLVIVTPGGTRIYAVEDLKGIFWEDNAGNRKNITESILALQTQAQREE